MRIRKSLLATLGATVLAAGAALVIMAGPADAATGQITGLAGKCVDVSGANSTDGTQIQLWTCNGTVAQQWTVGSDGTLRALSKCMDVKYGGTADGTRVWLWTCNGTGAQQWRFYTVPMNPGDPGLDTWKSLDAARHGGGHPWLPGVYDPETHLYIFGTGNPTPAYTSLPRGDGMANLFTCAIVAVNVDTGKMEWYYQTSPHDTHDWDSAQTPVLVDGDFRGSGPRKMVLTASRNGYYFTLDRRTGEHMVTSPFSDTVNWAKPALNSRGQPVREPAKDHHVAGALVSAANGGATNWPPPAYSPDTGLLYVPTAETYAMYYLTETDPRGAMGLGGKDEVSVGTMGSYISAIDYKTGKTVWKHKFRTVGGGRGGSGLLTTAGKLLFGGDVSGNFVAFDPASGNPLWHTQIGQVTNAPETYMVDGRQHILIAAGDTLYAFALYE